MVSWALITLPVFALLTGLFWNSPGIALLIFWWLKPAFERLPLYLLSEALFGQAPSRQTGIAPMAATTQTATARQPDLAPPEPEPEFLPAGGSAPKVSPGRHASVWRSCIQAWWIVGATGAMPAGIDRAVRPRKVVPMVKDILSSAGPVGAGESF